MLKADHKITENFSYYELTKSKDHPDLVKKNREYFSQEPYYTRLLTLAEYLLENIRFDVGGPLMVNSCARFPLLNDAVGGSQTSQHMFELPGPGAADIWTPKYSVRELFEIIEKKTQICWHQLRVYPEMGFIHISMPTGKNDGQVQIIGNKVPMWFLDHAD